MSEYHVYEMQKCFTNTLEIYDVNVPHFFLIYPEQLRI